MKLAAVTITYHPDIPSLKENIRRYIDGVDHLVIWDNTPDPMLEEKLGLDPSIRGKISIMGTGNNVGIAYAANEAAEWADKNMFTHLLTMDQDSLWEDFISFKAHISQCNDSKIGVFAPSLNVNGIMRENSELFCFTSGSVIPISIFREIGLFREDFSIDAVDREFCYRCRENGYHIQYFPDILNHSLGKKTIVEFAGKKYFTYNYSPFRLYHITKNNICVLKEYRHSNIDRLSVFEVHRVFYYYLKHLLIGEEAKGAKTWAMIRGYFAGLFYNPAHKQIRYLTARQ